MDTRLPPISHLRRTACLPLTRPGAGRARPGDGDDGTVQRQGQEPALDPECAPVRLSPLPPGPLTHATRSAGRAGPFRWQVYRQRGEQRLPERRADGGRDGDHLHPRADGRAVVLLPAHHEVQGPDDLRLHELLLDGQGYQAHPQPGRVQHGQVGPVRAPPLTSPPASL